MTFGRFHLLATGVALALGLSACSSGPKNVETVPSMEVSDREIERIAALLGTGKVDEARERLGKALRKDPMDPSLLMLERSLSGNARRNLGPSYRNHTVAPGETMADIAGRFLGNRLKGYELAQYNGIDDPSSIVPGQVIALPGGAPPAAEPERAEKPAARPARRADSRTERPAPEPERAPAATKPKTDPAGARRARTAGLAALNRGEVAKSVSLLQRAAALDPTDAAIKRDLARAKRIAATVRGRR